MLIRTKKGIRIPSIAPARLNSQSARFHTANAVWLIYSVLAPCAVSKHSVSSSLCLLTPSSTLILALAQTINRKSHQHFTYKNGFPINRVHVTQNKNPTKNPQQKNPHLTCSSISAARTPSSQVDSKGTPVLASYPRALHCSSSHQLMGEIHPILRFDS